MVLAVNVAILCPFIIGGMSANNVLLNKNLPEEDPRGLELKEVNCPHSPFNKIPEDCPACHYYSSILDQCNYPSIAV